MPWSGSGTYSLPPAYSPEVNGTTVDATRYNGLTGDVATGISACLAKNGENVPTANLPMGSFKHTGAADATATGQYMTWGNATGKLGNLDITANTLPANGFYLPSANTLGFSSNTTQRGTVNSTGNWVLNAPSSGNTLTVTALNGQAYLVGTDGTTTVQGTTDVSHNAFFGTTSNHTFSLISNNTNRISIGSAGNITINAPSGNALTVNGNATTGTILSIQGSDRTWQLVQGGTNGVGSGTFSIVDSFRTATTFYIRDTGGIVVTAPSSAVPAVTAFANTGNYTFSGTASDYGIALSNAASSQYGQIWYQSSTFKIEANSTYDLALAAGGSAQLTISHSNGATLNLGAFNIAAGSGNLKIGGAITRFESTEQTCPNNTFTDQSVAHGGPRAPDIFMVVLRCKSAELGYSVGDEVDLGSDIDGATSSGCQSYANATNVGAIYIRTVSNPPAIRNKTTGALVTVTAASWRTVYKCLWL